MLVYISHGDGGELLVAVVVGLEVLRGRWTVVATLRAEDSHTLTQALMRFLRQKILTNFLDHFPYYHIFEPSYV